VSCKTAAYSCVAAERRWGEKRARKLMGSRSTRRCPNWPARLRAGRRGWAGRLCSGREFDECVGKYRRGYVSFTTSQLRFLPFAPRVFAQSVAGLDGRPLVPPKIFRYRYERSGPHISVLTLRENADSVDCGVINGPIDMRKDRGGGDMQGARGSCRRGRLVPRG